MIKHNWFLFPKRSLRVVSKVTLSICAILIAITSHAQTYSFITQGDMESGNWAGVPGATNLAVSFQASAGIGSTTALKTVTTAMGGDPYYIVRCDQAFSMTSGDKITVSFWAKGSVSNMRLQPWVQEAPGNQWMNFGDAYLTTSWKQYTFTVTLSTQTSAGYKVKFRGYNTGTMYIDNVQMGPVDYENVEQSGIYDVSFTQNGMTWPVNTFRSSCPTYQLGYQGMQSKDQHPLDLFANRSISYAKVSFTGSITVNVNVLNTTKVPVAGQTVRILPSRFGITSSTNGNVVSFTITQPGQYSVEIGANGYKNGLIIFADPVETDIPSKTNPAYKVLYEATASDLTSLGSYTGIYFRRGVHDIGIFNVPSNIKNIYFEDGSWVYGCLKMDNNPNVRIYGRGVLSAYKIDYRIQHSVEAINGSNNITLEGLVVADPKWFGVRLIGTNNTVSYAKVIGGWVYNMDGISAYAGSTVTKCFIWANDDAIKVFRDDIVWEDAVVWQLNNGGIIQMSWGGDLGGVTADNVRISRVDVLRAEWDVFRFNVGLLNCIGNKYHYAGWSHELSNWLIEDVVTENPVPLIWNITPDPFSHTHIEGLTMKNWDVDMTMGTSFINEIKGEDPNNFFSGFVFDNVRFNGGILSNENRIASGEMDNGGWTSVPNGSNHTTTFCSTCGTGNDWGMLSKTTSMNGAPHYTNVCNDEFHIDHNEIITVSYYARATVAGKQLMPFLQDVVTGDIKNYPTVNLSTGFQRFANTLQMDQSTSDRYKLKFRGFENAWIYIDKVQVGKKDWITLTDIQKQYLDLPTFLPDDGARRRTSGPVAEEVVEIPNEHVYPNPVTDVLNLRGFGESVNYTVHGMSGRLYTTGIGSQVDVSQLPAGMYVLSIDGKKKVKFFKK